MNKKNGICPKCQYIVCECKKTNKKIEIGFTQEDLNDLLNGKVFNWEFDGVKVKLFNEEF